MFEILKIFETIKNIDNRIVRMIYMKYTKYRLKKIFFNKFIETMDISNELLYEFFQFFKCTFESMDINDKYPFVCNIDIDRCILYIEYYDFNIQIKILSNSYDIEIKSRQKEYKATTIHTEIRYLNLTPFREIILMTIYNYCVSYIYGLESNLYCKNDVYIDYLEDLFI